MQHTLFGKEKIEKNLKLHDAPSLGDSEKPAKRLRTDEIPVCVGVNTPEAELPNLLTIPAPDGLLTLPLSLRDTKKVDLTSQITCLRSIYTSKTNTQYYKEWQFIDNKYGNPDTKQPFNGPYAFVIVWDKSEGVQGKGTLQFRMKLGGHFYLALPEKDILNRINEYLSINAKEAPEAKDYRLINIDDIAKKPMDVVAAGVIKFEDGIITDVSTKSGSFHPDTENAGNYEVQNESEKKAIRAFSFLKNVRLIDDMEIATKLEEQNSTQVAAPPTQVKGRSL